MQLLAFLSILCLTIRFVSCVGGDISMRAFEERDAKKSYYAIVEHVDQDGNPYSEPLYAGVQDVAKRYFESIEAQLTAEDNGQAQLVAALYVPGKNKFYIGTPPKGSLKKYITINAKEEAPVWLDTCKSMWRPNFADGGAPTGINFWHAEDYAYWLYEHFDNGLEDLNAYQMDRYPPGSKIAVYGRRWNRATRTYGDPGNAALCSSDTDRPVACALVAYRLGVATTGPKSIPEGNDADVDIDDDGSGNETSNNNNDNNDSDDGDLPVVQLCAPGGQRREAKPSEHSIHPPPRPAIRGRTIQARQTSSLSVPATSASSLASSSAGLGPSPSSSAIADFSSSSTAVVDSSLSPSSSSSAGSDSSSSSSADLSSSSSSTDSVDPSSSDSSTAATSASSSSASHTLAPETKKASCIVPVSDRSLSVGTLPFTLDPTMLDTKSSTNSPTITSSTTSSTSTPSCIMHNQDPDQGIVSAYCVCDGSTLPLISAPSTAMYTESCHYTRLPSSTVSISKVLPSPITNTAKCQVCTFDSVDEENCSSLSGCVVSTTVAPTARATVRAGSSGVHVGTLTGDALYTSLSNAITKLCPTVSQTTAPTTCETGSVVIPGVPFVDAGFLNKGGELVVHVDSASYNDTGVLKGFIDYVAQAANSTGLGKNCFQQEYMVMDWKQRRWWNPMRLFSRETPTHSLVKDLWCSITEFAEVEFYEKWWRDLSVPGASDWLDISWDFKLPPGADFDCALIEVAADAFAILVPEYAVGAVETGEELALLCEKAMEREGGHRRRFIGTPPLPPQSPQVDPLGRPRRQRYPY